MGILLIGGYAVGEFAVLLRETGAAERRAALERGFHYLLAAGGCALASFVNPYFYRLHVHILAYLSDGFFRGNITEFLSMNFQGGQARYFEIMLLAGGAAAFWYLKRGRLAWPLLFAVWAHLALYSARNVEIFVLLAAPPAAEFVADAWRGVPALRLAGWLRGSLDALRDFTQELSAFDAAPRWHAVSAVAVLALAAVFYAPHALRFPRGVRCQNVSRRRGRRDGEGRFV